MEELASSARPYPNYLFPTSQLVQYPHLTAYPAQLVYPVCSLSGFHRKHIESLQLQRVVYKKKLFHDNFFLIRKYKVNEGEDNDSNHNRPLDRSSRGLIIGFLFSNFRYLFPWYTVHGLLHFHFILLSVIFHDINFYSIVPLLCSNSFFCRYKNNPFNL